MPTGKVQEVTSGLVENLSFLLLRVRDKFRKKGPVIYITSALSSETRDTGIPKTF